MRPEVTAAGALLICVGSLLLLCATGQALLSGGAGLAVYTSLTGGADPWIPAALGLYGVVSLGMTVGAMAAAGLAILAGARALNGQTRQLRAASFLAAGVSGLWLATTCVTCMSVTWALPFVLSLIALGLSLEMPIDGDERSW